MWFRRGLAVPLARPIPRRMVRVVPERMAVEPVVRAERPVVLVMRAPLPVVVEVVVMPRMRPIGLAAQALLAT